MTFKADNYVINCYRCGIFYIEELLRESLDRKPIEETKIANISGWIRENQHATIYREDFERLSSLHTPTAAEKAEKLLKFLAKKYNIAGTVFEIDLDRLTNTLDLIEKQEYKSLKYKVDSIKDLLPYLSTSWTQGTDELSFLLYDYLVRSQHLLERSSEPYNLKITPQGWAYLEKLKHINPESRKAFIAYWFNEEIQNDILPLIKQTVEDCGYEPKEMGSHEHNNDINDEIIAQLKQSKFVIADFTGQRGGVYFESGFARGLGLEVIWLCKDDEKDKKNIHFDTNHYNFIFWNTSNLKETLTKKLKNRIQATIDK